MPEKQTIKKAQKARRQGKAPSTQAGEFVHEEIEHVREGKHGARSAKQAIAIGLSKARRAGVKLKPPARGKASAETRRRAEKDLKAGQKPTRRPSPSRSRSATQALKREGRQATSKRALSRQAKQASGKARKSRRTA
jgi:hypothetical protein